MAVIESSLLYPPHWIYFASEDSLVSMNFLMLAHQVFAGAGMFSYLRHLSLGRFPSLLTAVLFMYCGAFTCHKTHQAIFFSAAWLPFIVLCAHRFSCRPTVRNALTYGACAGLQFLAGNPQIWLYTQVAAAAYSLMMVSKQNRLAFLRNLILVGLGGLFVTPQVWSTWELAQISWRDGAGYEYFSEYSLTPWMLPLLAIPGIFGGTSGTNYWGAWNLNELSAYVGLLPVAWTASFLTTARLTRLTSSWLLIATYSLLLSLGASTVLYNVMFYVPIYNKFRCPARNLLIFDFAILVLFGVGLDYALKSRSRFELHARKSATYLVGFALLLLLSAYLAKQFLSSAEASILLSDQGRRAISTSFSRHNPELVAPLALVGSLVLVLVSPLSYSLNFKAKLLVLATLSIGDLYRFTAFYDSDWPERSAVESRMSRERGFWKKVGGERVAVLDDYSGFNVPSGGRKINAIQPLNPGFLLNFLGAEPLDFSQRIKHWDSLVVANRPLSLFGVRYLFFSDETQRRWFETESTGEDSWTSEEHYLLYPGTKTTLTCQAPLKGLLQFGLSLISREREGLPFHLFARYRCEDGLVRILVADKNLETDIHASKDSSTIQGVFFADANDSSIKIAIENRSRFTLEIQEAFIKGQKTNGKLSYLYKGKVQGLHCYENLEALPWAYCVPNRICVSSKSEVAKRVYLGDVKPQQEFLEIAPGGDSKANGMLGQGEILNCARKSDSAEITVSSKAGTYLIVNEQAYPGWTCTIGSVELPIRQAYGCIQFIELPPGEHKVELRYKPFYLRGLLLGSVIYGLLLVCVIGWWSVSLSPRSSALSRDSNTEEGRSESVEKGIV